MGGTEVRCKKKDSKSKCEFRNARSKGCNMADQSRPLEKTNVANVLQSNSVVVAAEELICERINTESTNKLTITEWWVQKLKLIGKLVFIYKN